MAKKKKERVETDAAELVSNDGHPTSDSETLVLARAMYPTRLPILAISGRPASPQMSAPMVIEDANLKKLLLDTVERKSKFVGLVLKKEAEDPSDTNNTPKTDIKLHSISRSCRIGVIMRHGNWMAGCARRNGHIAFTKTL